MGFRIGHAASTAAVIALCLLAASLSQSLATEATKDDSSTGDAWDALEDTQLNLAMGAIFDDQKSAELQKAAQSRYGLDEDGAESFMTCMVGLGGHPDFSTAKVIDALDMCSRTSARSRN